MLESMGNALNQLPTPPNRQKKQLLKEIHSLQNKWQHHFSNLENETQQLENRFIDLAQKEIEQGKSTLLQRLHDMATSCDDLPHLQSLTEQLSNSVSVFKKFKQGDGDKAETETCLPTIAKNGLFSSSLPSETVEIPADNRIMEKKSLRQD